MFGYYFIPSLSVSLSQRTSVVYHNATFFLLAARRNSFSMTILFSLARTLLAKRRHVPGPSDFGIIKTRFVAELQKQTRHQVRLAASSTYCIYNFSCFISLLLVPIKCDIFWLIFCLRIWHCCGIHFSTDDSSFSPLSIAMPTPEPRAQKPWYTLSIEITVLRL